MRNFKFAWLFALGMMAFMTSCDKADVALPLTDSDQASALVDMMFLATADDSTVTSEEYGHKGKCSVTEVAVEDLSATITDYITANYADATINRAGTNDNTGNTYVKITLSDGTGAGLAFDADGTFVAERTRGSKGTSVAEADLPVAITDYIAANYEEATVKMAMLQSDGSYGVLLILADETYQGVGFDADGAFVAEFSMKNKGGHKHGTGKRGGH
ncbi:hypothetical protein [Arcticibacterium luteifluviistationis]|uniref:Beta-lactamase-inhibitor-like PepSY-like domain-containing protein n=1 Tax=Arcticibacterium luteifluviistationis TaxID=1784714 RepID=A0A2Z4GEG8_9BACT|nr:hypothetical protein [Arcticibacterium luteifluviistationis]AWV99584.1 hypothetical protein DJ013_15970 [Arcticibacterium luteifluviistationis]